MRYGKFVFFDINKKMQAAAERRQRKNTQRAESRHTAETQRESVSISTIKNDRIS